MKCCICGHETESLDDLKERCIIRRDGKARYIPAGYTFPPADKTDMAGLVHFPEIPEKELDMAGVACVCKKDRCRKRAARWLAGKPATGTPTPTRRGHAFGMSSVLPADPPASSARHARQERRRERQDMSEADAY